MQLVKDFGHGRTKAAFPETLRYFVKDQVGWDRWGLLVLDELWNALAAIGRGSWSRHLEHHIDPIISVPGTLRCPHLQYKTPQTPDIDFQTISTTAAVDYLRSHPLVSPPHGGKVLFRVEVGKVLRDSKIRYLADPSRLHKNILGFQVLWRL